jgi:hypothetical protein
MTICAKCKHCVVEGVEKCRVTLLAPKYQLPPTDYVTGRPRGPQYEWCCIVNQNGNCAKFEARLSKPLLWWKRLLLMVME